MVGGHLGYGWISFTDGSFGADDALQSDPYAQGKQVKPWKPLLPASHVVTFVREPVARVVSHWRWANRKHPDAEGPCTLLQFAARPVHQNVQSRYLQGAPLDEILCLGVTERFGESLQLLEKRSGIRLEEGRDNADPSQIKYQPTADEVARIRG